MVEHPILLRGLGKLSVENRPTLLQRTDKELIPVLLAQLQAGDDLQAVAATVAQKRDANGLLKLYHPVQRTFTLVLFEAVCFTPGLPRLDPDTIESAGVVIRRLRGNSVHGWLSRESSLRGWIDLQADQVTQDPDPSLRRGPSSGNALIDRSLALRLSLSEPLAEQVTDLFVAPPAVCQALGKTVLYGVLPVTSGEFSEKPAANQASSIDSQYTSGVAKHVPIYLRAGGKPAFALAGQTLSASDADPKQFQNNAALATFVEILRVLSVEFDLFATTAEAKALFAEINTLQLLLPGGATQPMGDFFKQATDVLLDAIPNRTLTMPTAFPALSEIQAQKILQLIVASLSARLIASEQGERRFEDTTARYMLRGFVRVNRNPSCPPELVWSENSEPYTIAPWYESAETGLPLPQVALPNPFDRDALRQLKPNVSFKVPEELFKLMNSDLSKVIDGDKPSGGDGFGLDWLCSFSLPIITLCAFLVLNIFLSLFDIVFRWLLFIKICIPIPKKG